MAHVRHTPACVAPRQQQSHILRICVPRRSVRMALSWQAPPLHAAWRGAGGRGRSCSARPRSTRSPPCSWWVICIMMPPARVCSREGHAASAQSKLTAALHGHPLGRTARTPRKSATRAPTATTLTKTHGPTNVSELAARRMAVLPPTTVTRPPLLPRGRRARAHAVKPRAATLRRRQTRFARSDTESIYCWRGAHDCCKGTSPSLRPWPPLAQTSAPAPCAPWPTVGSTGHPLARRRARARARAPPAPLLRACATH